MGLHASSCPAHAWACMRAHAQAPGCRSTPGHRAACRVIGAISASRLLVDGELEDDEDGGRRQRGADLDDADRQMKVQA
jgi:hypothetical protein